MKKRTIIYPLLLLATLIGFASCSDFLEEMPDNRAEVDSESKVLSILVSAYPQKHFALLTEYASDNLDDYTASNPYYDRYYTQMYEWADMTETGNESVKALWDACYNAIASANAALEAIQKLGTDSPALQAAKGEALICRAYNHFILASVFCHSYDPNYPDDLGIPYIDKSEEEFNPKHSRGTLAGTYAKIEDDIKTGLPLISDAIYTVPKYHFNQSAAYAFAARFYLHYHQPDKTIEYSTRVLGSSPQTMMRDRKALQAIPVDNIEARGLEYTNVASKANFLLLAPICFNGPFVNNYAGSRYSHGAYVAETETIKAQAPWGTYNANSYYMNISTYASLNKMDKLLWVHSLRMFEMKDPVAQTGYYRTVFTAFTGNEALLDRAEAYILQKDYTSALADMNTWIASWINVAPNKVLTTDLVDQWANSLEYYDELAPTPKKAFNAPFTIEPGTQENMLHALLFMRRCETLYTGQRWFDVKRFGIEIVRRTIPQGKFGMITDRLPKRDPRRAMQIPQDVISAGLEANPR